MSRLNQYLNMINESEELTKEKKDNITRIINNIIRRLDYDDIKIDNFSVTDDTIKLLNNFNKYSKSSSNVKITYDDYVDKIKLYFAMHVNNKYHSYDVRFSANSNVDDREISDKVLEFAEKYSELKKIIKSNSERQAEFYKNKNFSGVGNMM